MMNKKRKLLSVVLSAVMILALFPSIGTAAFAADDITGPSWSKKANMLTATEGFGTCSLNNKIYTFGGNTSGSPKGSNLVECYDVSADTWSYLKEMPTARRFMSVAEVNGIIYAIGGGTSTGFTSVNEAYDPTTNLWTSKKALDTALYAAGTAVVDNKIYVIGGLTSNFNDVLATVKMYDPQTDTWTAKKSMTIARGFPGVVVANGKIYAISGWTGGAESDNAYTNTVEMYDPTTDTWTTEANIDTAIRATSAVGIGDDIYVLGGHNLSNNKLVAINTIQKYSISKNTWSQTGTLPEAVGSFGVSKIQNNLYIYGGYDFSNLFNTMYQTQISPTSSLKVVLGLNETLQLSVNSDLSMNSDLAWTSSDASVATVDANGAVTAIKEGNTKITCTNKDASYTDSVNVLVVKNPDDYRLAVDLKVGNSCRLTVDDNTNTAKVTWSSLDSTIATVSSSGKVKALSAGLTLVTAKDDAGKDIGQIYVRTR